MLYHDLLFGGLDTRQQQDYWYLQRLSFPRAFSSPAGSIFYLIVQKYTQIYFLWTAVHLEPDRVICMILNLYKKLMVSTESHFLVEIFLPHTNGAVYTTLSSAGDGRLTGGHCLDGNVRYCTWCVPWSNLEPPLPPLSNFWVVPASLWWPVCRVTLNRCGGFHLTRR